MKKLIAVITMFLGFNATLQASCNLNSLKGTYSVAISGRISDKPCASIGVMTFNVNGTLVLDTLSTCLGYSAPTQTRETTILTSLMKGSCVGYYVLKNDSETSLVFDRTLKTAELIVKTKDNAFAIGTMRKQ